MKKASVKQLAAAYASTVVKLTNPAKPDKNEKLALKAVAADWQKGYEAALVTNDRVIRGMAVQIFTGGLMTFSELKAKPGDVVVVKNYRRKGKQCEDYAVVTDVRTSWTFDSKGKVQPHNSYDVAVLRYPPKKHGYMWLYISDDAIVNVVSVSEKATIFVNDIEAKEIYHRLTGEG